MELHWSCGMQMALLPSSEPSTTRQEMNEIEIARNTGQTRMRPVSTLFYYQVLAVRSFLMLSA